MILKVRFPVPLPDAFVALTMTTTRVVIAVVGVPAITPVVPFKLNPDGNTPLATA